MPRLCYRKPMKITSWNVNSIKAREEHVKRYLSEATPDVLMIQELKGLEFPADTFEALDYHTKAVTQKTYNGVAVFSKAPITVILDHLPGDDKDEQARYIEFETQGLRLINIYLPNGNPVSAESEKYPYKLGWMERLYTRLKHLREEQIPFAIGGDFNVIPEDKDCKTPKNWEGDALFRIETHHLYKSLLNLGFTDAFRVFNSSAEQYSFWDYQRGCWARDDGIRIDHFLTSPSITDKLINCTIDKEPRGWDKPSDHTPITIELAA